MTKSPLFNANGLTAEEWKEALEALGSYADARDMDEADEVASRAFALISRARITAFTEARRIVRTSTSLEEAESVLGALLELVQGHQRP